MTLNVRSQQMCTQNTLHYVTATSTKRNETKRNETKRNRIKCNRIQHKRTKQNQMKRNKTESDLIPLKWMQLK